MIKQKIIIAASIMLFACGSNAETNDKETIKDVQSAPTEVVEEHEVVLEETIVEIQEELMTEETPTAAAEEVVEEAPKKAVAKVVLVEKETELVTEVEGEKTVEIVVKAKHDVWNTLTSKHVTTTGKVNYKGMKAELSQLTAYLAHLKNTHPKADWTKNEKLAYWINLYNASTVYLIASNYPTASITKLNGGKPWDKEFVKSGDKVYTLNEIEHEIVRPRFKDPRIHAALNCAAVSCPKMLNGAFFPGKLSTQLDQQCYAWINDRDRNEVGPNSLKISQIFDWYKDDFKAGGGVIQFIGKYNRTKIMISPNAKISYKEYNWDLNE